MYSWQILIDTFFYHKSEFRRHTVIKWNKRNTGFPSSLTHTVITIYHEVYITVFVMAIGKDIMQNDSRSLFSMNSDSSDLLKFAKRPVKCDIRKWILSNKWCNSTWLWFKLEMFQWKKLTILWCEEFDCNFQNVPSLVNRVKTRQITSKQRLSH